MELKFVGKKCYANAYCTLQVGGDTSPFEVPEEVKAQMLEDFPELFEAVTGTVAKKETVVLDEITDEVEIETPEDGMEVETPERKFGKIRKK